MVLQTGCLGSHSAMDKDTVPSVYVCIGCFGSNQFSLLSVLVVSISSTNTSALPSFLSFIIHSFIYLSVCLFTNLGIVNTDSSASPLDASSSSWWQQDVVCLYEVISLIFLSYTYHDILFSL